MKKILVLVIALAMLSGFAFAGDNQSARYLRMIAREPATDSIDIAYFNPAGTAFLAPGFHSLINAQTVYLNYEHTNALNATSYEMKNWIPFVPAAYFGYVGNGWAAFLSYNIPEGGGSLDYDNISLILPGPTVVEGSLVASSSTHAIGLGGSYQINEMFSVGARGEISIAMNKYDADVTALGGQAEMSQGGVGFGGAFGVHFRPFEGLNASMTVETIQKIELEEKDSSGAAATLATLQGFAPSNADRPWKFRGGFSYTFPFGLEVPVAFKYSLWKPLDENVKANTFSTSIGLRYWMMDTLEVSLGGSYSQGNVQDDQLDTSFYNPELDSINVAGGIGWEIINNLTLDFGILYPIYFGEDGTAYTDQMKQVIDGAISIQYVF